jgi:adenylate kinase family enzyme
MSGKTTMAKHLVDKYGFTLLDFKDLIEQVKKTKIDPENPDAEPEITYNDLLNFLKTYVEKIPKNKRILVENFFIPNAPETPFLIDTYEKAVEIVKVFGKFRNLYEIECDEKTLTNRYKVKEGITEEISEDQKAAFTSTLEKPKQLLEDLKGLSSNVIKMNCDEIDSKSKACFDYNNQNNFIVVKHEYDIIIEKTLELFAAKNRLLYINVPKLIYCHFYLNDEYSKKLEANYGKKKFKVEIKDPNNFDELIFYKYNPIHFEKNLVNEVILNCVYESTKKIEKTGNYVILTGYLNYDLVEIENEPYNLPLLELKNVMELGDLNALIQVTRNEIKQIEDEEAVQLVIEKPKKKEKKEGEEGEEGEEEEQQDEPEEENPDAPKFKPEEYKWTSYDGVPRNYVQILKRLKNMPIKVVNIEEFNDKVREEIIKAIAEHLDNYVDRSENGYNGIIKIIKLAKDSCVPNENVDDVNATSELIEKRREIEGSAKKGKGIQEIL